MGEQEINLEQEAVIIQSGGGGAVDSVNGQTGDVVLTTSDLENTSDYQTGSEVESAISEAISELPTVNDATLTIQKNGASVGTFTANDADNTTINITVPTTAADVSALPASTKYGASISVTIDSSTYVMTTQLKDQDGNNLGSAQTVDLPLESVVVNGSYDSTNKKIILTLQNGNTIDIPVADLVSGLQTEITSDNKLSADLVDDTSTTNKFVTASEKNTWNAKQDALTAGANITIEEDSGTGDLVISASGGGATYTAGANIQISPENVISATDTTYNDFVGTDGVSAGTAGLVPAPATTDAGKFLGASGLWEAVQGGGGITELTTADIDYPDANPTGIALWRLDSGTYYIADASLVGFANTANELSSLVLQGVYIIGDYGTVSKSIVSFDVVSSKYWVFRTNKNTGAKGTATNISPSVVQTPGTSQTDVMSQDAVTSMVFADPATQNKIKIGAGTSSSEGTNGVEIGSNSQATGSSSVGIGNAAKANGSYDVALGDNANNASANGVAIGRGAKVEGSSPNAIALGGFSKASGRGVFSVQLSGLGAGNGYNNTDYRLLTGLYDGQSAHDAVTKGQLDTAIINGGTTAPTTATVGAVGTQYTYVDTTGTPTAHLCVCTEIDTTDPSTPVYTWQTLV